MPVSSAPDQDHYDVLGVAPSAPHQTVQRAYRERIRTTHPDVAGEAGAERAARINEAWRVLKDPRRRADYDRLRIAAAAPSTNGQPSPADPGVVPSWGPDGIRPVTLEQLREAARRESAYSPIGYAQRRAFSAAIMRVGVMILVFGAGVLALVLRAT